MKLRILTGALLSIGYFACASTPDIKERVDENWYKATAAETKYREEIDKIDKNSDAGCDRNKDPKDRTPICNTALKNLDTVLDIKKACTDAQVPVSLAKKGSLENPQDHPDVQGCLKAIP